MEDLKLKKLLLGTSLLTGVAMFGLATPAFAQDADTEEPIAVETIDEAEEEEEAKGGEIVVTGSRIKRDTFSSISPIQVITSESSMKAGLIDPAAILQQDDSASGQQIDATFSGFVLDNGPGSQTLNLRGLDPRRTLVMINGRRAAPSGVGGSPTAASVNMIPGSLVDRYDLLLDGASSVYGSDAVAGVANIILRKDFDGFELIGNVATTEQGGNTDYTIAGNWGGNNDRGFIGVGVEYDFRDAVTLADRDFLADCEKHVEIDQNGQIRNRDIVDETSFDVWYTGIGAIDRPASEDGFLGSCNRRNNALLSGRANIDPAGPPNLGAIYRLPGSETNIGIPGFVDQTINGVPLDTDGDGRQDYGFPEFSRNGTQLDRTFITEQKRATLMAYGEYTLEGEANLTPFFEALFVRTEVSGNAGAAALGLDVSAENPFNPCGNFGQDCGAGVNALIADPAFRNRWNTYYRDRDPNRDGNTSDARICAIIGAVQLPDGQYDFSGGPGFFDNARCSPEPFGFGGNIGPQQMTATFAIEGDRNEFNVIQENLRLVGGFKGDLPFMNAIGSFNNWSFEASITHSSSTGSSVQKGVREDRLYYAVGNNIVQGANFGDVIPGQAPCTPQAGVVTPADVATGCVPVNVFADNVLVPTIGNFTQAERDYLFDSREFETTYKQTVWNAFATGAIASVPAGSVTAAVGVELRHDEIDSRPNRVAGEGLLAYFSSDLGAVGEKMTSEVFGEIDIPLVADKPFFKQLDANVSARLTKDEFYGTNQTYSAKVGWRPVDSLLLKASYGTSFRAPNLRENFLAESTGFPRLFDHCVVPTEARVTDLNGDQQYVAAGDTREGSIFAACAAEGVDARALGLDTAVTGFYSAELAESGTFDLNPETSTSWTLGFSFEQPFTDAFDMTIGASMYKINVEDAISELGGQFIVNDCYANVVSIYANSCDRITRDNDGFLDFIQGGFENIAQDIAKGVDFNAELSKEFAAFDMPMEASLDLRGHRWIDRIFRNLDNTGNIAEDTFEGEFGFPKWSGRIRAELEVDNKWTGSWTTRYVGAVEQDVRFRDNFGDALGTSGFTADTCGGPAVNDVLCRDVGFAGEYFVHAASFSYRADTWRFTAGVSNIFDNEPPEVDFDEVFSISNVPIGNGYDLQGRRFFFNARKSF